ncbi:MAG: hypothetical protein K2Q01_04030 [Rickettsiales bacterium]|nr:hypothetical protein [Rickettsiales bacterium]
MPTKPRTLSLEDFLRDLRRENPRLVVLVGEAHNSVIGRRLTHQILQGSQLGLWEQPNKTGNPMGSIYSRQHFQERLREEGDELHTEQWRQNLRNMTVPPYTVQVDTPDRQEGHRAEKAKKLMRQMRRDGIPAHDETYRRVKGVYLANMQQRLEKSNEVMAETMVKRLDHMFPDPRKRFYAVGVLGAGHLRYVHDMGLSGTPSDIKHTLEAAGYTVVALDLKPQRIEKTTYHKGGYQINPSEIPGIDYQIDYFDPYVFRSASQRA